MSGVKTREFPFGTHKQDGVVYLDVAVALENAKAAVHQYLHVVGRKTDERIREVAMQERHANGKGLRVGVSVTITVEPIR